MEGVCSTHEKEEKFIYDSGRKISKKRDHLENIGVDGMIILKLMLKKQDERIWPGFV
jgi:hypothetical protein